MTEEQRKAALNALEKVSDAIYLEFHPTPQWKSLHADCETIREALQTPQPEVVTAREFNAAWVKYDDSIYMADFLQAEYPNGLRIVKENNNAVS